jgi:penicillin-binding protein activator
MNIIVNAPKAINHKKALLSVIGGLSVVLAGCANPPVSQGPTVGGNVTYGDAKAVETVTNEFGSSDLQLIAETMSRSLLQHPAMAGRPLIVVAEVKNKTSEYIDTRNITNTIKTQLSKAGVRFATDNSTQEAATEELLKQSQSGLYKKGQSAKLGNLKGAKYMLVGEFTSIVKKTSDLKDVYYKFTLILKNVEEGVDEWQDEKDIRKTSRK